MNRTLSQKVAFVDSRIRELGLQIPPQSRLALEAGALVDSQGNSRFVPPDDARFAHALESLRDYTLFEFVLDNWPFDKRNKVATDKLRTALKDAVDPVQPARTTRGRDAQLELYVAVGMHRAGLSVTLPYFASEATPDIRVQLDKGYFFVEAKRPKSRDAIDDVLRGAIKQIATTGCPGAVFIDASRAFNPTNGRILRIMPNQECYELHATALRMEIRRLEAQLRRRIEGTPVVAVCFQSHLLRQHSAGWSLDSCCCTYRIPNESDRLRRVRDLFSRSLNHAW